MNVVIDDESLHKVPCVKMTVASVVLSCCGDKCLLFHDCDKNRFLINVPCIVLWANVTFKNTAKVMTQWIQE